MRGLGVVLLLAVAGGCTSVRMVQREGCWVRQTQKVFGRVTEELGPCVRPPPQWSQDRLTRLVQECVAQADYRWAAPAMEAWARQAPAPARPPPQQDILRTCMEEARVELVTEHRNLQDRLAEAATERESLRRTVAADQASLRASHELIAELLGEAAQKPAGTATATATATGSGDASNENGTSLASESGATSAAQPVPAQATEPGAPAAPSQAPAPAPAPAQAPPPGATTTAAPAEPAGRKERPATPPRRAHRAARVAKAARAAACPPATPAAASAAAPDWP